MIFKPNHSRPLSKDGSALITVLLALSLLMSLGVPFLLAGRLRSEASREIYDRARARLSVESAVDFARLVQLGSHPTLDSSPLWDHPDEWNLKSVPPLPQGLEGWENSRESWGVEVESAQGRIGLATAPPLLLQNLLQPCYLTGDVSFADRVFPVNSTAGFPDSGVLLVGVNWVSYGRKSSQAFEGVAMDPNSDNVDPEATRLREGTGLIDERMVALTAARLQSGEWTPPEFFDDLLGFQMGGAPLLEPQAKQKFQKLTWLKTGAYGADAWMPATLLNREPNLDLPGMGNVTDASGISAGTVLRVEPEGEAPFYTFAFGANPQSGLVFFPASLPTSLQPWTTRIYPLRREPVDINAAEEEVLMALLTGLRLTQTPVTSSSTQGSIRNEWVSIGDARRVVKQITALRPFQGPDDFWNRLLEPMMTAGNLSPPDAWAIHLNGLDPNSGFLRQSTLPFGYRSGDQYLQRVDSAIRSRLGRTLSRAARFVAVSIAPGGPLLRLWETQEDFEDLGRWSRGLHGTTTLPFNRGNMGGHHEAMNGLTLHTGAWEPTGRLEDSKESELSAVIPVPVRDMDPLNGGMQHFDLEPSPLGYNAEERGVYPTAMVDWGLGSGSGAEDDAPLCFQGWFRFSGAVADGVLFDLTGDQTDRSRVSAAIEEGILKVRAWDDAGDDPFDPEQELQAQTVEIDLDEFQMGSRWFHLSTLLRTVSPRGFQVALDGVPRGDISGFTWLTTGMNGFAPGGTDDALMVESTEGFPDRGVLRVGREVVEYSSKTETSFITQRVPGPDGYIGGRAAREGNDAFTMTLDTQHDSGAAVELYGYSTPLVQDLPPGGATLSGDLGPFSVAEGIEGSDIINIILLGGNTWELGLGISGDYLGPLSLEAIPYATSDPYYEEAFQSDGGYAVLAQRRLVNPDADGFRVGGMEIVRYSMRSAGNIYISERNVQTPGVARWPSGQFASEGHSFVTEWNPMMSNLAGEAWKDLPQLQLYVIPISVKGTAVSDFTYPLPNGNFSEFVQITDPGDAGLTEWVRYDSILNNCFLRDDWDALNAAALPVLDDNYEEEWTPPGGGMWMPLQDPGNGQDFSLARTIGEPITDREGILESIRREFDFRGTMGTFDHAQSVGKLLVPVAHTPYEIHADGGYVGRGDRVAVIQENSELPPYWYQVQWGRAPRADGRIRQNHWYSAFNMSPGLPFTASDLTNSEFVTFDRRKVTRLVKFPSGERMTGLHSFVFGGDLAGNSGPFAGYLDEVGLHMPSGMGPANSPAARGAFLLKEDLAVGDLSEIEVEPSVISVDGHRYWSLNPGDWLQSLPDHGLIDIDGERMAIQSVDAANGIFSISPNGRGLHGTLPRFHAAGAKVWRVDGRFSSVLSDDIRLGDSSIPVRSLTELRGDALLLVDQELISAPLYPGGNRVEMPRRRPDLGDPDTLGEGILRGRFGTIPASHDVGTLVYAMPTRWQDRYVERSDSPFGAWFEVGLEEPEAYWRGVLVDVEIEDASQRIMVLARTADAGWEDDPETTPGLVLLEDTRGPNGLPVPIGFHSDRLDLRIIFDWREGAFDPIQFLSFGWTTAPRVRRLVVDYLAESRIDIEEDILE